MKLNSPELQPNKHLSGLSLEWIRKGSYVEFKALDQRLLPHQEVWHTITTLPQLVELVKALAIRGAPLIGISASLGLAQYFLSHENQAPLDSHNSTFKNIYKIIDDLAEARPTAVNLRNNLGSIRNKIFEQEVNLWTRGSSAPSHFWKKLSEIVTHEAERIFEEDVDLCLKMAENAATKIPPGAQIITICNTGGLATAGIGTALGAIKLAAQRDPHLHVWVCETRPLFQGSRLTCWELKKAGIRHTLITDSMAGFVMKKHPIDLAIIGADRIANNGDVANKIGSYSLAILCQYHKIPFYVVAPQTTFDKNCDSGESIPIEVRNSAEILMDKGSPETETWNPAFDVVPKSLITQIISDAEMETF